VHKGVRACACICVPGVGLFLVAFFCGTSHLEGAGWLTHLYDVYAPAGGWKHWLPGRSPHPWLHVPLLPFPSGNDLNIRSLLVLPMGHASFRK
jgi:hypothetical protein